MHEDPFFIHWTFNSLHCDGLPTELGICVLGRQFLKWALFHAPLHILDFVHFLESI